VHLSALGGRVVERYLWIYGECWIGSVKLRELHILIKNKIPKGEKSFRVKGV